MLRRYIIFDQMNSAFEGRMKHYLGYLGRNNEKLPLDSRRVYNSLQSDFFLMLRRLIMSDLVNSSFEGRNETILRFFGSKQ